MEEEERKGNPHYFLCAVLAIITAFFFGLSMGAFRFDNPFRHQNTASEKKNEATTEEPGIQTAVLTYKILDKDYTDEELMILQERLSQRLHFWDSKGTVECNDKGNVVVRMQRDYACDANIKVLTQEEHISFCVVCEKKPTDEELKSGQCFEASGKYYQTILEEDQMKELNVIPRGYLETDVTVSVFQIELTKKGKKLLKKELSDRKKDELLLLYNRELIGTVDVEEAIRETPLRIFSMISADRANIMMSRIRVGNLPLKLELVSNEQ
jgi:hypothetical protein